MIRNLLALFLLLTFGITPAQLVSQQIIWQKSIGGSGDDFVEKAIQTKDKGMLITCSSSSGVSGNKTDIGYGGFDYWILKANHEGEILWQKTMGGDLDDEPITALETRNGGYLICGESSSGLNGSKSMSGFGKEDFWVVKLNKKGKTIWQQSYGGSWVDHMVTAFSDPSGGYVLAGYSWMGTDDIRFDSLKGRYDWWLVAINEKGKVMWEESYGGIHDDIMTDAIMDRKGNIVMSGYSKTKMEGEEGHNSTIHKESSVTCISADKKLLWQKSFKDYGNYSCEKLMADHQNQYYVGGDLFPGIAKANYSDILIIVLNESGNVVRDITIGGNGADFINHMAISGENETYFGASSDSGVSNDKSEPSYGLMDGWISKYDKLGQKQWDKTIGGTGLESFAEMLIGPERDITVFLQSNSGKTGNLTEKSNGESDIVIVRLED